MSQRDVLNERQIASTFDCIQIDWAIREALSSLYLRVISVAWRKLNPPNLYVRAPSIIRAACHWVSVYHETVLRIKGQILGEME